ncbi:MAG: hypothetical protein HZB38_13765 [Planctomycetes bacterium]|nr:hypothetical protein [Planctomycetota bacterium]
MIQVAAERKLGRRVSPRDARQSRQAAVQLASTLFFAPMLAEMRKLPMGQKFGNGGRGEEVFGEQLDLRLADSIAGGDPGGIVRNIAGKLQRQAAMRAKAVEAEAAKAEAAKAGATSAGAAKVGAAPAAFRSVGPPSPTTMPASDSEIRRYA